MREDLIGDINQFLGTEHQPTRDKQMPATMLYDLRDKLELGKEYETRREILTQLDRQNIIKTNQIYTDTKHRLGVEELDQLKKYLHNNVPRGVDRARNKFKKVAAQT